MNDETMTTGDWFITLLLLSIPVLNIILFIVWAAGSGNRNRVTYCRATLLWAVIGIGIVLLLSAAGAGLGG